MEQIAIVGDTPACEGLPMVFPAIERVLGHMRSRLRIPDHEYGTAPRREAHIDIELTSEYFDKSNSLASSKYSSVKLHPDHLLKQDPRGMICANVDLMHSPLCNDSIGATYIYSTNSHDRISENSIESVAVVNVINLKDTQKEDKLRCSCPQNGIIQPQKRKYSKAKQIAQRSIAHLQ